MVGIACCPCNGVQEQHHQYYRGERGETNHAQRGGVYALRIFPFLCHKAEEGGLHSECQQYYKQRDVSIDIGDDAVFSSRGSEARGLNGHQQVVYESCNDARQSINSGVFC